MDIRSTATYPYPIWGLDENFNGEKPSGQRKDFKKNSSKDVFELEYEVTSHNEGIDKLINEGLASYFCIVQCPSTYYTQIEKTKDSSFTIEIPCNKVNKRFSVKIEIVATQTIIGCDYLDVDDFYEGVVDYQKGSMISLIDKFNISLTAVDGVANLGRIIKYEYTDVPKITNKFANIITIQIPSAFADSCNYVMAEYSSVFEGMLVHNALIEAIFQLRNDHDNEDKDWVFFIKQFIDNMVAEGDIEERIDYDFEFNEIKQIVDNILPDVMLTAIKEIATSTLPSNN